ncbi:hypothetical protein GCM10007170_15690 [Arthrobacter liuii]|uniref:Uncharacterized protein n=1 Tax=Arthrobacter liuii TaxID=1476996 RepID=A0ABQ2APT1_9MICC|nr:hypothetical protein GCM10007170_15690 [Arthrobacter liuii]
MKTSAPGAQKSNRLAKVIEEHTADWTTWGENIGPEDCDYYTCLCGAVRWHVNGSTDYYEVHAMHVAKILIAAGYGSGDE